MISYLASDGGRDDAEVSRARRYSVFTVVAAASRVTAAGSPQNLQRRRREIPWQDVALVRARLSLPCRRRRRRGTAGEEARDGPGNRVAVVAVVKLGPAEELAEDGGVLRGEVVEVGDAAAQHQRVGGVRVHKRLQPTNQSFIIIIIIIIDIFRVV